MQRYAHVRVGFYVAVSALSPFHSAADVAAFDYADFGERLLGFSAHIILHILGEEVEVAARLIARFMLRFSGRVIVLRGDDVLDYPTLRTHGLTHLYIYKYGHTTSPAVDALVDADRAATAGGLRRLRVLVHAAVDGRTPHGDVYARVSASVQGGAPVVPLLVRPRELRGAGDLRAALGIPIGATVFGRHGGYNSFDIPAARRAVLAVAHARPHSILREH